MHISYQLVVVSCQLPVASCREKSTMSPPIAAQYARNLPRNYIIIVLENTGQNQAL